MEPEEIDVVELELKYCECCGGLWLRRKGLPEVYCASCATAMSEFAISHRPSRKATRAPRLPIHRDLDIHGQNYANVISMPAMKGGNS
jgi:Zn-finger nucleic acid-binding protein